MIANFLLIFVINMLIILVVISLIAKSDGQTADSCFYTQRFTFFKGNSVASPQRPAGYNFNVSWESTQPSIINSSIFYTVSRNQRYILMNYQASIISTTHAGGTIWINPINGSQILSITMNIVLLKSCSGTARLILTQLNSLYLGMIWQNFSIDAGITFRQNISNYKYEIFVTDFDGYPTNGSTSFAFHSYLRPISLNTNLHALSIFALPGTYNANYTYVNRIRYTYVVVDITSFLITPITQNHIEAWLSSQIYINVNKDFSPDADKKCMIGIKSYIIFLSYKQDYNLSIQSSTNYSLTYKYSKAGNNFIPTLFCIGFCREGTGRSSSNVCTPCPNKSITCSNQSYLLTCTPGYYPQPTVLGVQKCFICMPGCKICTNYTFCIQCQPTNLPTKDNDCQKCPNKSWLAGGICSSVPGCSRAQLVDGKSVCMACNPQQHFYFDPIDQKCVCKSGYNLKDGICIGYCGDGIILTQQCDDNNTVSSDGCSSECKQEKGYECSSKPLASHSKCLFKEKISIELISIERVNLQNRIILLFRVLPSYFNDLSPEYIKGSLQTNLSVVIETVTVEGKFITVQMIFDQDIEKKQALFHLSFYDPSTTQNQVYLLIRFRADQKLVKLNRIKLAKTIKYLFCSAIICIVLIFLVSLKFHKMIGLETILPFQIIYKTQLFSLFQYYAGSALNYFFYINGQSFIQFSIINNTLISNNQKFTLIFLCCVSYSTFFLSLIGFLIYCLKSKQPKCNENLQHFAVKWHNRVSLPIFSWFLIPLIVLKSALSINKNYIGFSNLLLVFQCLMMASVIFYEWRAAFSLKSLFVQSLEKQPWYIPSALGFLLMVSFVLSASFLRIIQILEPRLLSLCSFFLIIFIYIRPYKGVLDNTGVIVGMVQLIFFLGWGLMRRTDPSVETQENQMVGLFISFGLAAVNIIIGTLRVFFEALRQYRQNSKKQAEANSSDPQQKNGAATFLKQTVGLQARYETKLVLPMHLKHININCIDTVPFQHFNPISKEKKSQLKKYLMQRINAVKKSKQSFKN